MSETRFPSLNDPEIVRKVRQYCIDNGSISNREARQLLGIGYDEAIALFNSLVARRELVRTGTRGGTRYTLARQVRPK